MEKNKTFLLLIEEYHFSVFSITILIIALFYLLLKKFCDPNRLLIKESKHSLKIFIAKSFIFIIISFFLNYLLDISYFFENPELNSIRRAVNTMRTDIYHNIAGLLSGLLTYLSEIGIGLEDNTVLNAVIDWVKWLRNDSLFHHLRGDLEDSETAYTIWLLFLFYSVFNFSLFSLMAHILVNIIFSSIYIYFNIQFGFVSLLVLFFSYSILSNANFVLAVSVIAFAIIVSWGFFKLKKRLLNTIRTYFASLQPQQLASRKVKIGEFYLICTPYIIYATIFNLMLLESLFNLIIQLILSHLFSYFVIFKLYKAGHDMGFDYDPF